MEISEQLFAALIEGDQEDLAQQLRSRVRKLQMHPSWEEKADFGVWFRQEFPVVLGGRLPRGMKAVRDAAYHFIMVFHDTDEQFQTPENLESDIKEISRRWSEFLEDKVDLLVKHFSKTSKGGQKSEIKIGAITIRNDAGVAAATLKRYAGVIAAVFSKVKGWRRKALQGGLTVVLAPATAFRGTASGRYKRDKDEMWVRTTPKVMKGLENTGYGHPQYILIHELGHRYEAHHPIPGEFRGEYWYTTRYSRTDSLAGDESFAELFALGHFGITRAHMTWNPEIQVKFEKLMGGGSL